MDAANENLDPNVMAAASARVLLGWLELQAQVEGKLDWRELELLRLGYRYGVALAIERLR
jgi:hypothetical protein